MSTHLNFASKSSKGKILRVVKNFNGPFITPLYDSPVIVSDTKHDGQSEAKQRSLEGSRSSRPV